MGRVFLAGERNDALSWRAQINTHDYFFKVFTSSQTLPNHTEPSCVIVGEHKRRVKIRCGTWMIPAYPALVLRDGKGGDLASELSAPSCRVGAAIIGVSMANMICLDLPDTCNRHALDLATTRAARRCEKLSSRRAIPFLEGRKSSAMSMLARRTKRSE